MWQGKEEEGGGGGTYYQASGNCDILWKNFNIFNIFNICESQLKVSKEINVSMNYDVKVPSMFISTSAERKLAQRNM